MEAPATLVRFVGVDRLCPTTATFSFARPDGYRFEAGQYFALTILTEDGPQSHYFTHCDAPGDDETMVLTRLSGSAYKDALLALRPGDEVSVRGPMGRLTVPPDRRRVAFLVGGVGVTPARSIVRDAAMRATGLEALVFYGNTDESCIPFRDEFDGYGREHAAMRFVHVLGNPSKDWEGERGYITAELVRSHCDPLDGWHWYVAGPPAMVTAMRTVLDALGVPAGSVAYELFAGYR
jgi:ferredoxin-NADP reductase